MVLSMASTAFAADSNVTDPNSLPNTYTEKLEDGDIFIQQSDWQTVVILTSDKDHIINIAIKYFDTPDMVYQWVFDNYPISSFFPDDFSFWTNVIEYAEGKKDEASVVSFTESDVNQPITRSSAGADLQAGMISDLGQPYTGRFKTSKIIEGHTYRIYETMEFIIRQVKVLTWNDAITVAGFIAGFIGLGPTTKLVSNICTIFGLATTAATAVIPAGKMNKYSCMAQYTRYVTIDNSERDYSYAYKFVSYDGGENASDNDVGRAQILFDTKDTYYGMTEEFYNDYDLLFDDAYRTYNNIWP